MLGRVARFWGLGARGAAPRPWWRGGVAIILVCTALYTPMQRLLAPVHQHLHTLFRTDLELEAFWAAQQMEEALGCPKTYVYDLPARMTDFEVPTKRVSSDVASSSSSSLSSSVPGLVPVREAIDENANLAEVLVTRLRFSARCRAASPGEADLFIVPVLPRSKHWSDWSSKCDALTRVNWRAALPFLSHATARRHFFVFPRVAYSPRCRGWWTRPTSAVAQFARVSIGGYEEFSGDFQRSKTRGQAARLTTWEREHPQAVLPRLVSVPYVATIRWSAALEASSTRRPWARSEEEAPRPRLLAYSATPHGSPSAVALRLAIAKACSDVGPRVCDGGAFRNATPANKPTAAARLDAALAKKNATFCVEPPGLTPGRQSIVNALLLGCIPVLFGPEQDALWPLHWGAWRADSRVLLDPRDVTQRPSRLVEALHAIPQARVRAMQDTIARRAHTMQYALDDQPGDALETTLNGLLAAVR